MKNKFKYRMYGFVPYNISEIQKGIQFGHAVVEYGLKFSNNEDYQKWAKDDKTFIILNGGTTSLNPVGRGTLNQIVVDLDQVFELPIATFYEPDLGDQLTAVVFLLDDRYWDYEKYQNFVDYTIMGLSDEDFLEMEKNHYSHLFYNKNYDSLTDGERKEYRNIVEVRQWLIKFKLA